MRSILLTFIALVSSRGCLSGHEIGQNTNEIESIQSGENKTELNELNYDVLYLILKHSEFDTLLNLVQMKSRISDIASEMIRRKYRDYDLKMSIKSDLLTTSSLYLDDKTYNQLIIYDFQFALDVIKHFGPYFQKIEIYDPKLQIDELIKITQYITKYCTKSLKSLELHFMIEKILDKFTEPLEATEELIIRSAKNVDEITKPLNELFPKLRRLKLISWHPNSFSFIKCKLPHIEYFFIDATQKYQTFEKNVENIKEFMRLNPILRSLELNLDHPTMMPDLTSSINQYLPQLENLTLFTLSTGNGSIEFGNVKKFEIKTRTIRDPSTSRLSMPKLVELNVKYEQRHFSHWMQFFNDHAQIQHLNFMCQNSDATNVFIELLTFTSNLQNLTDVTIALFNDVEIEYIIQFMENHQKMNKFEFVVYNHPNPKELAQKKLQIRERRGDEWNIEYFQNSRNILCHSLFFERARPTVE